MQTHTPAIIDPAIVDAFRDARPDAPRVMFNVAHQRLVNCATCGKALLTIRRTWASRVNERHLCAECFDSSR